MKITKSQLMKIIKEELAEGKWFSDYGGEWEGGPPVEDDSHYEPSAGGSARRSAGYDDGLEGNKFHWAPPEDQEDPEYVAGWKEGKAARRIESMRPVR